MSGSAEHGSNVVRIEPRQLGLGEIFFRTRDAVVVGQAGSGRIVVWNQAAIDLFGYSDDEAIGLLVEDLVPDALKERHRAGISRYARDGHGELIDAGTPVELPAVHRDGTEIWVEMSLTPIDANGLPGHYAMAIVRNITDRKRLEAEFQRTQDELTATVEALQRRGHELSLINELGDLLHSCTTTAEAADVISHTASRLFPGNCGALYLFAPSRNVLDVTATWGSLSATKHALAPEDCWALRRGRLHMVEHSGGIRCGHLEDVTTAAVCVPMVAQGEILGLLHLRAEPEETIAAPELAVAVAEHLGLALANFRLRETLQHQSIRDPLTNLYNRRYMEESLEREVRRAGRHDLSLAVVAIDIDHFKTFNDTFGHEAGDTLLRELGDFLHSHVRAEDVACRQGGEEFLLILPYATVAEATTRAEQLCEGVRSLGVLPRSAVSEQSVTISLGVAAYPDHADAALDLLRAADDALYQAKRQGRDRVVVAEASTIDHAPPQPAAEQGDRA